MPSLTYPSSSPTSLGNTGSRSGATWAASGLASCGCERRARGATSCGGSLRGGHTRGRAAARGLKRGWSSMTPGRR
eukprot:scaffold62190_cov59-Phaeocystis_antarctica.AAC.3